MNKISTNVMMTAVIAVIIVTSTIITGCAGSATKVIVAPGYKKQFAINADLAVVMLDKSPNIIYLGDVDKSLSSVAKSTGLSGKALVWDYFGSQLARDIMKEIDVTDAFKVEGDRNFLVSKEFFKTSEEDITVEIPSKETQFTFDSTKTPALVLLLEDIRIGTETDPYFQERAQHGLYISKARKLVYVATFVLWDNRERRAICYGRVKTETPIIREEATLENWEEVSREFVRTIFAPTGFKKREEKTTGVELIR